MKRIFSILLILVLLIGLMPVMPTVALAESYATVTSENGLGVNLREGPGTGYKKIDAYPVGTTVRVLQQGSDWSQIQLGDSVVGWMMSRFLIFGASAGGSSGTISGSTNAYVVSDNGLRVWLRASAGGTRLFLNAAGTPVEVITYDSDWCYIRIGATYGYMKTQYLSVGQQGSDDEGEGSEPVVTSGRVTEVEINYTHPVVLDTLEAIVTSPDAQVDYEWYVRFPVGNAYYPAGAEVMLGTEATFDVLTRYADCEIRVKVTGKDGSTGTAWSDWTAPVQISKGLKSVEIDKVGAPAVGDVLNAILVPSSALGDYSWRVGGVEVSTESTYTVQESDLGKMIQLRVTGIGGYVGTVACSADAAVVSDKELQSVELNKLNPVVGDTLSAVVLPEGAEYTYSWLANGEEMGTSATLKITNDHLGKQITVNVTGTDPYTGMVSATTGKVSSGKLQSVTITGAPVLGETVYAKVNPDKVTAVYEWWVGDTCIDTGIDSSFYINDPAWIDEKIMVRAYPSGVYTVDGEEGFVEYTMEDVIFEDHPIHSIALLNTSPVVGDTIEVELQPENAELMKEYFSYVWYVDDETYVHNPGTDAFKYEVKESDAGKKIRVQVIGKVTPMGDYTGETAYSTRTSTVVTNKKITDITIVNVDQDLANARKASPIAGDTLVATVVPASAAPFVDYTWYDFENNIVAVGDTYTVDPGYEGKSFKVTAEVVSTVTTDYINNTVNYEGTKSVNTAAVKALNNLVVNFHVRKPEPGIAPMTSTSSKDADGKTIATATIEWLQREGAAIEPASFDKFGHFEPGATYIAKLTVSPKNGKSLYQAAVSVTDGTLLPDPDAAYNTNVFYFEFTQVDPNTITDFYIGNLDKPMLSAGVWKIDEDGCGNDQVWSKFLNWHAPDATGLCYYEIELEPHAGMALDFSKVPENAFKVNGAARTENAAGSNIVRAYYQIERELFIDTDKSEVYLDGYNRAIVQCSAYMTNYTEPLTTVKWEIVSAKVDGTTINDNGQLIIGMYEAADRNLTIRATVDIGGELYSVEKDIVLISGTSTDTAIAIVFKQYATRIEEGATAIYKAIVSNSTEGCTLFVTTVSGTHMLPADGTFDTSDSTYGLSAGSYAVIKAISNEDHSVMATLMVEIVDSSLGLGTNQVYNEDGEEITVEGEFVEDDIVEVEDLLAVEIPDEVIDAVIEETVIEEAVVEEEIAVEEIVVEETVVEEEIAVEEIVVEEETVVEEPVIEEEIAVEETVVEETVVEETVVEETVVEEEVIDPSVIVIKDTVSGETIENVAEEPVVEDVVVEETVTEEPVVEEEIVEDEIPEDVTIAIKDTVTGEVVEEEVPVNSEKPAEEKKEEEPVKTEAAEEKAAEDELVEEIPDEELDALEGEDIGKSVENEAQIVISFIKSASEVKRGNTAEFAVEVTGSEAGVQWMLRRSKNADGKVVSSISQDGVLTVSADETSEKLVVIAASAEDTSIRARWVVAVPQKSAASSSTVKAEEAPMVEEIITEEIVSVEQPEEVVVPEAAPEAEPEIEEEIVAEDEGLSDDILKQIEEELRMLEQQQSVLNFF